MATLMMNPYCSTKIATPTDSNDKITPGRKTVTPTQTHIGRDISNIIKKTHNDSYKNHI
ncbi:41062_t:CDS:2 [Gigaspora margarita]|uniref:41062_t:CDS:1 n=1 Tax=Gigaspora margarita TaxID=4874 RepID=A0ABN7V374_GIGMA|nr:41062_t:CDS:2 [Gigaspora margarita]